jgi:hypothetical protein
VQGTPAPPPIVIHIVEPKSELQGLSDVLLGSLGLAGILIICAVLLAGIFAGGLLLWRSRSAAADQPPEDLHVTP